MFWIAGDWLLDALGSSMQHGLDVAHMGKVDDVPSACLEILGSLWRIAGPVALLMGTLVGATLLLGYGQIGLKWSREVIGFKLERINPFVNWHRVMSMQAIVRLGFAVLKVAVIVGVLWLVLGDRVPALLHLHEREFAAAAAEIGSVTLLLLLWIGATVFALSAIDLLWQRWHFEKRNMMTKQEIEDERKRAEGDPAIKQRQRRARNELLRHRMMAAVPKADVVITNPTHYSVALRYDRKRDFAPTVVAKGVDEVALNIRQLARANGVPLMEDPPLARALYRAVKIGQAIPERFYQAVATVLGHVYRLRGRTA
jgi:flagellar biosynthetic protein FlhB